MIYCFDLDGTLCSQEIEDYTKAVPNKERIAILNGLYEDGHTIVIDSARGSATGKRWFKTTVEQLDSWGVKYHRLRVGAKVAADIYVDDKAENDEDFFGRRFF